jgi:hypothetical protein
VSQIDPELRGGVREETVPIQFLALRRALGRDTVGLKALPTPAAAAPGGSSGGGGSAGGSGSGRPG